MPGLGFAGLTAIISAHEAANDSPANGGSSADAVCVKFRRADPPLVPARAQFEVHAFLLLQMGQHSEQVFR